MNSLEDLIHNLETNGQILGTDLEYEAIAGNLASNISLDSSALDILLGLFESDQVNNQFHTLSSALFSQQFEVGYANQYIQNHQDSIELSDLKHSITSLSVNTSWKNTFLNIGKKLKDPSVNFILKNVPGSGENATDFKDQLSNIEDLSSIIDIEDFTQTLHSQLMSLINVVMNRVISKHNPTSFSSLLSSKEKLELYNNIEEFIIYYSSSLPYFTICLHVLSQVVSNPRISTLIKSHVVYLVLMMTARVYEVNCVKEVTGTGNNVLSETGNISKQSLLQYVGQLFPLLPEADINSIFLSLICESMEPVRSVDYHLLHSQGLLYKTLHMTLLQMEKKAQEDLSIQSPSSEQSPSSDDSSDMCDVEVDVDVFALKPLPTESEDGLDGSDCDDFSLSPSLTTIHHIQPFTISSPPIPLSPSSIDTSIISALGKHPFIEPALHFVFPHLYQQLGPVSEPHPDEAIVPLPLQTCISFLNYTNTIIHTVNDSISAADTNMQSHLSIYRSIRSVLNLAFVQLSTSQSPSRQQNLGVVINLLITFASSIRISEEVNALGSSVSVNPGFMKDLVHRIRVDARRTSQLCYKLSSLISEKHTILTNSNPASVTTPPLSDANIKELTEALSHSVTAGILSTWVIVALEYEVARGTCQNVRKNNLQLQTDVNRSHFALLEYLSGVFQRASSLYPSVCGPAVFSLFKLVFSVVEVNKHYHTQTFHLDLLPLLVNTSIHLCLMLPNSLLNPLPDSSINLANTSLPSLHLADPLSLLVSYVSLNVSYFPSEIPIHIMDTVLPFIYGCLYSVSVNSNRPTIRAEEMQIELVKVSVSNLFKITTSSCLLHKDSVELIYKIQTLLNSSSSKSPANPLLNEALQSYIELVEGKYRDDMSNDISVESKTSEDTVKTEPITNTGTEITFDDLFD